MALFETDGSKGDLGHGVNAVYVSVEDSDLVEIFPTNLSVRTTCQYIGSPTELGTEHIDNKVRMPTTIEFAGVVKSGAWDCLSKAREAVLNGNLVLCTVYAKNGEYSNMMIEEMSENSTPQKFDSIEVRMRFKEYIVAVSTESN